MLSSWKEIAHFFGKGVRTVQRWEKTLDLPIHRPPGAPSNVVLARTSDLEEWMHRGPSSRSEQAGTATSEGEFASLAALQEEVVRLARYTDVAGVSLDESASTDERIRAMADAVSRANAKLASGGKAVRAA